MEEVPQDWEVGQDERGQRVVVDHGGRAECRLGGGGLRGQRP